MHRALPLLAAVPLLLACGSRTPGAGQASGSAGQAASTAPTGGDASDLSSFAFTPPENGQITAQEVEMYIAVQKKAAADRAGRPAGSGDVASDPASEEIAAARALGDNPKEYIWVADRIREVLRWQTQHDLAAQLTAGDEDYRRLLKSLRAAEKDKARAAELDARISDLGNRQVEEELTLALSHNSEIVEKYRDQIDAVTTDEEKFSTGRLPADQPIPEELFSDLNSDLIDETPPP